MNHEKFHKEDIDQVEAFLQAGHHLTPSGGTVTLNTFKKDFRQHATVPSAFPIVKVLKDHFPDHEKAMRAASVAKVAATGRIVLHGESA